MYLKRFKDKEIICDYTIFLSKKYSEEYSKSCGYSKRSLNCIHPTELVTLSLKEYLCLEPIPNGSIHTSQEIEIFMPIPYETRLLCKVYLDSSKNIKDKRLVMIKTNYFDNNNKLVASSKGTLLVPVS